MIDREMDELALLWTQDQPAEDEQLVQTLARRVGWRARLLRHADLGAALIIAAGVALLVLTSGNEAAAASGLLIVLAVAWSSWKRHAMWDVELSLGAPDSETFLVEAKRSIKARLKRTEFGIVALVPAFLLGGLFGLRLKFPEMDTAGEMLAFATADLVWTLTLFAMVGLVMAHLVYSRNALRRELGRVDELAREYQDESAFEGAGRIGA